MLHLKSQGGTQLQKLCSLRVRAACWHFRPPSHAKKKKAENEPCIQMCTHNFYSQSRAAHLDYQLTAKITAKRYLTHITIIADTILSVLCKVLILVPYRQMI